MNQPILPWVQHVPKTNVPTPPHWFVPFPEDQPGVRPLLTVIFVPPAEPFTQGKWHTTVLNMFIVPVEASIWEAEKVKLASEEIFITTLSKLNKSVEDLIASCSDVPHDISN